jgi:hypothetical protein
VAWMLDIVGLPVLQLKLEIRDPFLAVTLWHRWAAAYHGGGCGCSGYQSSRIGLAEAGKTVWHAMHLTDGDRIQQ